MSAHRRRVLFVCLGNICRSPAAEGVLRALLQQRGLSDKCDVDSAGTSGYHIGEPADRRMRAAAAERGLTLTSRARMVHPSDFAEFDWIVAMDRQNRQALNSYPQADPQRLFLLSDFLDDRWPLDVPDPYLGDDEGFSYVLDMLQAACPTLLDRLQPLVERSW